MFDMIVSDCIYDLYHYTLKPTYYLGNSVYICKHKIGKINLRASHLHANKALILLQGYQQFGYILNQGWAFKYDSRFEMRLDPLYYNDRLDAYIAPFNKLFKGSAIIILDNKDWVNNREFKAWIDAMNSSDAEIRRSTFPLVFKQSNRVPVNKFVKDANSQ